MTILQEAKTWVYIDKNRSQCDIIDKEGAVFGHICRFTTKELANTTANKIRKVFTSISFKLLSQNQIFDLYGDYYKLNQKYR